MKKVLVFMMVLVFTVSFSIFASAADSRPKITAKSISVAPTIDGTISETEWGAPVVTYTPDSENVVINMESVLPADLEEAMEALPSEVKLYVRWDKNKLYVGAQVTDKKHHNPYVDANAWIGDSFECDIGVKLADQKIRFRNNIALSSNGNTYAIVHNKPNPSLTDNIGAQEQVSGVCKVARSGNITTYEMSFLWSVYSSSGSVAKGYQFYLNPQLHIADGVIEGTGEGYEDYLGFMRYAGQTEQGSLYPLVTLSEDNEDPGESSSQGSGESSSQDPGESSSQDSDESSSKDSGESSKDSDNLPGTGDSPLVGSIVLFMAASCSILYFNKNRKK